jgi:molybdate transport system substrate-binding protein
LLATGRADPDPGAVPYALGRLALYGRGLDPADGAATLRAGAFTHLAVANPKTAPYGAAALEALAALGLRETVEPRLVFGENIGQAMQFVDSGAAEFGLCALSQVVDRDPAHRWIVPATLHAPIAQGAVLLGEAVDPGAARDFLRFLSGPAAHEVLRRFGYEPVED